MKIEICKTTHYQCTYTITRNNQSTDSVSLDAKTYFVHDICHFAVEKSLNYENGFWGMLAKGYAFCELSGRDNPLTEELRFIEQIVGPVQSVFLKNIPKENFSMFISHLDFELEKDILDTALARIESIMNDWKQLPVGECITLTW